MDKHDFVRFQFEKDFRLIVCTVTSPTLPAGRGLSSLSLYSADFSHQNYETPDANC